MQQQAKSLHEVRQSWRQHSFGVWLASSRRDAQIAQAAGLLFSDTLCDRLRRIAKDLDDDALACLVGGMYTDASRRGAGARQGFCWDCSQAVVPCVDHVLWFCPGHADLRKAPRPPGELAARLGWDGSLATDAQQIKIVEERLLVMGAIRRREWQNRGKRDGWRRAPAARGVP